MLPRSWIPYACKKCLVEKKLNDESSIYVSNSKSGSIRSAGMEKIKQEMEKGSAGP
jgi:hypothetical protein